MIWYALCLAIGWVLGLLTAFWWTRGCMNEAMHMYGGKFDEEARDESGHCRYHRIPCGNCDSTEPCHCDDSCDVIG